jgi:hypothetical protein
LKVQSVRARTFLRVAPAVAAGLAVFGFSWFFRFNDPNGSFAGLTDDHFFYLVRGWQILFGELPVRDFVDHGAPLSYYVGAAVQLVGGRGTFSELVFCVTVLALAATGTYALTARSSGSVALALAAAAVHILLEPRFYNYPKIIVYVAAIPAVWAVVDRPSNGRLFMVALITAVGFLFRHDHGAFVAVAMAAALVVRRGASVATRAKHAALYGAMVVALLVPYLAFIQINGGIASYLQQASAWAERDRDRAPVVWPGVFDNPDGVSEAARDSSGLPRAIAVLRDNGTAWLFYLELILPFVALAVLALSPDGFRPDWQNAAAKIAVVAVLAIVLDAGFLRSPLEARLADPSVPLVILLAWLWAAAARLVWRRSEALRPSLARLAVPAAAFVLVLMVPLTAVPAVVLTNNLADRLDSAGFVDRLSKPLDRAQELTASLHQTWPLERWIDPRAENVMRLAFYLRDCTGPDDRVLMQHYLPQVPALAQRGFAGGHADLRPGFFRTPEAQRLTIERLQRQSVPIVVLAAGDDLRNFRRSFPQIAAYFDEHYTLAGERDLDGRFMITVLVSRQAGVVRQYEPLDLPCLR